MSTLRTVIIGVGAGIFSTHLPPLRQLPFAIVGVTDVNNAIGKAKAEELQCPFYADHRSLLADTKPDVAVIVTPHPFHAPLAIDALTVGCHVLVEKPLAVTVAEADAMIRAAKHAQRNLTVSFQHRFRPEVQAAKALIQSGRIGQLQHIQLTALWPRTARYFGMSAWRGTWKGEGGGILMNQSPHNLDMLCHLVGLPNRVFGIATTNIHKIETEDTATALLEWESGMQGMVHVSTAETGIDERLEIVGTKGRITLTPKGIEAIEFEQDVASFAATSDQLYVGPASRPLEIKLGEGKGDHMAVYTNLYQAITEKQPLLCDGSQARMSLELANAIISSSRSGRPIKLPINRAKYTALLQTLIEQAAKPHPLAPSP